MAHGEQLGFQSYNVCVHIVPSYIANFHIVFFSITTRRYVETKLPELRTLNQNTFFFCAEINEQFKADSACHLIYGDGKIVFYSILMYLTKYHNAYILFFYYIYFLFVVNCTEEAVLTSGLSCADFEKVRLHNANIHLFNIVTLIYCLYYGTYIILYIKIIPIFTDIKRESCLRANFAKTQH